jgi:pilus assembly protein CpaC
MATSLSSLAQEGPSRVSINAFAAKKMTIINGKSLILESKTPIKRISIAAPEIADAIALTPWQIYVAGNLPGITNLSLWDEKGKKLIEVFDIEVVPDTARLKEKIYEMYEGEDISVTADHNTITLSGSVSSTAVMDQILALARSYAPESKGGGKINNFLEVAGVHQVMLEVRVSEMARSTIKKIGFNWNYVSDGGNTFGISVLDNLTDVSVSGSAITTTLTDPINMIFRFGGANATWTTFIDALKENGLTKVLAEPTLITLSGKQANFLAGGEFPIPVPDDDGNVTIDYKTYGVGLNFTPIVLNSGKISMEVAPEVSDLDYTNAVTL